MARSKKVSSLIDEKRKISKKIDDYESEYYYWTEWECEEDIQYKEINGVLTLI